MVPEEVSGTGLRGLIGNTQHVHAAAASWVLGFCLVDHSRAGPKSFRGLDAGNRCQWFFLLGSFVSHGPGAMRPRHTDSNPSAFHKCASLFQSRCTRDGKMVVQSMGWTDGKVKPAKQKTKRTEPSKPQATKRTSAKSAAMKAKAMKSQTKAAATKAKAKTKMAMKSAVTKFTGRPQKAVPSFGLLKRKRVP